MDLEELETERSVVPMKRARDLVAESAEEKENTEEAANSAVKTERPRKRSSTV